MCFRLLGEALIKQLSDTNWKERLQAVEQMKSNIHSFTSSDVPTQILCRAVLLKPGIKDTNFQVLSCVLSEIILYQLISDNLCQIISVCLLSWLYWSATPIMF